MVSTALACSLFYPNKTTLTLPLTITESSSSVVMETSAGLVFLDSQFTMKSLVLCPLYLTCWPLAKKIKVGNPWTWYVPLTLEWASASILATLTQSHIEYQVFLRYEAPWQPHRILVPISCNVRTWINVSVPWGVELDEDMREFFNDSREVISCQYQDMILFSVTRGKENQAKKEEYLCQHFKYIVIIKLKSIDELC